MPRLSQRLIQYSNLATLTPEDLTAKTVTELRKLAPSLGIDGYSKMKKADLVSAIVTELETLGAIAQAESTKQGQAKAVIQAAKDRNGQALSITPLDVAEKTYEKIQEILASYQNLDSMKEAINAVAAGVARSEMIGYQFSTTKSRRTDIFKFLKTMASDETELRREDMESLVKYFTVQLCSFQMADSMALNYDYKVRTVAKNADRKPIEISKLVADCQATLQALADGLEPHWCDVSIAVALGSGRRMVEIHSLGSFEVIGEYRIAFSGQAKTRGSKGARLAFDIPTLYPAKLIKMGVDYLVKQGRTIAPEIQMAYTKAVNRTFNTALSRAMAKYPEINYKGLRSIYAECTWEKYADHNIAQKHTYYSDVLGHQNKDGLGKDTFMSYMVYQITDIETAF